MSALIPIECVTCFCLDDSRYDCLCHCHPDWPEDMTLAEFDAMMDEAGPAELVTLEQYTFVGTDEDDEPIARHPRRL